MKILLCMITVFTFTLNSSKQDCPTIKPKSAKHYIGKEVIVCGKFIRGGNSSYAQLAWFYLGNDTSHKQLKVIIQGKVYASGQGTPIISYQAKEVKIKGIVKAGKEIYLEATDTLKLK